MKYFLAALVAAAFTSGAVHAQPAPFTVPSIIVQNGGQLNGTYANTNLTLSGGGTLTGVFTAPTADAGTDTQQLATTAFVASALVAGFASPPPIGNAAPNTGQFTLLTVGTDTQCALVATPGTLASGGASLSVSNQEDCVQINIPTPIGLSVGSSITSGGTIIAAGNGVFGEGVSYTTPGLKLGTWNSTTSAMYVDTDVLTATNLLLSASMGGNITLQGNPFWSNSTIVEFSPNGVGNSGANYLVVAPALTNAAPSISAAGSDTNVSITLTPKGTGDELVGGPINPSNPAAPLSLGTVTSNGVIVGNTSASQISINGENLYLGNSDGSSTTVYALGSTAYLGSTSGSSTAAYVQAQTVNIGVIGTGATSTNVNGDNLFLGDTTGASNDATLSAHYIAVTTSNGMTVGSPSSGSYEGAGTINAQGLFVNGTAVATGGPYLPLAGGTLTGGLTGTTGSFSGLVAAGTGGQVTLGGASYTTPDANIGDTYDFDYLNQTITDSSPLPTGGDTGVFRWLTYTGTNSSAYIVPVYGIATLAGTTGYAQAVSGVMEFSSTGVGNGSAVVGSVYNDNTSVTQGSAFSCANTGTGAGLSCFDFFTYGVPFYDVEFFDTAEGIPASNALLSDTKGTTVSPLSTKYGTQWSGNITFSGAEYTSPGFLIGPTVSSYNARVEVLGGSGTAGPTIGVAGSGNGALGAGTNGVTPATNAPLNIQALGTGTVNFNSHLSAAGTAPALTACGTSPTIDATASDTAGTITEGATATGCTATFHATYATAPHCVVGSPSGSALTSYSTSTTALTLVNASATGDKFTYVCMQ